MLKQNTTESGDPPVTQIRVKREEFARAISALEARRQEEAKFLEGTVAVADTLRELQVDASAEEVMQQIEAQRAGYAVEKEPRRVWDRDKITDLKLVSGIVLVPLLVLLLCATLYHPLAAPSIATPMGVTPDASLWMSSSTIPSGITERQIGEGGFNASSVLRPLSQVPDNQVVHCNNGSLQALFNDYTRQRSHQRYDPLHPFGTLDPTALAGSNQVFDVRPNLRKPWALIKHEGRLYLRAWVAAKFTETQAQGYALSLHSSPRSFDPGVQPVPITLPISFRVYSGAFGSSSDLTVAPSLSISLVKLDQYAWEKW